ncbi:polysaccharide deacetylase family protein [Acetobacteraceae bacterium H6797]|nr:polysaccharide deacetylase family protein [Acetobacteraceae bacterium H6797]
METRPYPWPEGKRAAALISIDVDADTPLLWRHRAAPTPLLSEWEQRQYGLRDGIPRLLALLARHEVKASFFVPGAVAARQPELLPRLLREGHEVGLHGYLHEAAAQITEAEFAEALGRSIGLFQRQTGRRPAGFRAPGWELTRGMLAEIGAAGLYDSSLAGYDHPYTIQGVTELPISWNREDTARFKLTGVSDRVPASPLHVLEEWLFDWEASAEAGALFTLTLHDWVSTRPAPLKVLDRLLTRLREDKTAWIATGEAIAAHDRGLPEEERRRVSL